MTRPRAHALSERIGAIEALDVPGKAIGKQIRNLLPAGGGVKDVISGVQIGHALHPLMTDVPIGTWTSATLLDLLGGRASRPAAKRLIGVGLAAAAPGEAFGRTLAEMLARQLKAGLSWEDAGPGTRAVLVLRSPERV